MVSNNDILTLEESTNQIDSVDNVNISCFQAIKSGNTIYPAIDPLKQDITVEGLYDITVSGGKDSKVKDMVTHARTLSKAEYREYKKLFPAITGSLKGYKSKSRKDAANDANLNGLVIVDIDKLDAESAVYFRDSISSNEDFVVLAFISPSGKGVKFLCAIDSSTIDEFDVATNQLCDYITNEYGVEVDRGATTNMKGLCFISYDSQCYYNPEPTAFEGVYDDDSYKSLCLEKVDDVVETLSNNESLEVDKIGTKIVAKLQKKGKEYVEGKRFEFIQGLSFEFNRYGVPAGDVVTWFKNTIFNEIKFDDDDWTKCAGTIYGCYKNAKKQFAKYQQFKRRTFNDVTIITENGSTTTISGDREVQDLSKTKVPLRRMIDDVKELYNVLGIDDEIHDRKIFATLMIELLNDVKVGKSDDYLKSRGRTICEAREYKNYSATVDLFVEVNQFLKDSHKEHLKEVQNVIQISLEEIRNPTIVIADFVKMVLQPKVSQYYGYEILYNGKYQVATDSMMSSIEDMLLRVYDLSKDKQVAKIVKSDTSTEYNPVEDNLKKFKDLYESEYKSFQKNPIEEFIAAFTMHNRIDTTYLTEEQIVTMVTAWGVKSVAQGLGDGLNENMLGAISNEQGTAKSMFMKTINCEWKKLGLVSRPSYSLDTVDNKRELTCNFIMHDDELEVRNKKTSSSIKEYVSVDFLSWIEKYLTFQVTRKRTANMTYCGNTVDFLTEDSRRDLITKFNEHTLDNRGNEVDFANLAKMTEENEVLTKAIWGYLYKEYLTNYNYWVKELHKMKDILKENNEQFKTTKSEHECVDNYVAQPLEGATNKGYDASSCSDMHLLKANYKGCNIVVSQAELVTILEVMLGSKGMSKYNVNNRMKELGFKTGTHRCDGLPKPKKGYKISLTLKENITYVD